MDFISTRLGQIKDNCSLKESRNCTCLCNLGKYSGNTVSSCDSVRIPHELCYYCPRKNIQRQAAVGHWKHKLQITMLQNNLKIPPSLLAYSITFWHMALSYGVSWNLPGWQARETGCVTFWRSWERRHHIPHTAASAALVRAVQRSEPEPNQVPPVANTKVQKRKRCNFCPAKKDCKTGTTYSKCEKHICKGPTRKVSSRCFEGGD